MTEIDHMDDPRMDQYKDLPLPFREVRSWRLAEGDAKRGMTWEQRKAYNEALQKEINAHCAERGIKLKYAESVVPA